MSLAGLHLALVGPLPPPAGGMAMQTLQLADLLRAAGAQVELVQTNAPYRPAWVGRVPVLRAGFRLLPYLAALWRACGRVRLVHLMANSGWSWHLFAAPAIWIAWLRGVPVLVNYRGGEAGPFLQRSARVVGWSLRRAARLLVPSGFLQQVFARHGLQAALLPNIVDLQRFAPAAQRRPGPPRLLVARNLEAIYDNATAIRALAALPLRHAQATLTLAGSGPEEAALRALVAGLGLGERVRFAGRLSRDEMAALLADSDVAINPSRVDNMPNSVLEAMAAGVPVLSTDVGGVPYIVRHGHTARLVPAGDPQAMAAELAALLDDPAAAAALAVAARAEVQRYTWPQVQPLLVAHYAAVLGAAGGGTLKLR